ncbi:MAG: hypothetical protein JJ992_01010, partial [Planctomycetes bacterium]|nr:hypothetical protein [Planctomycetota bacterium]
MQIDVALRNAGDLRDRLRDISRTARETEETLDSLVRKREKQAAELRRLTIPLESVEYAISFLERLQRSCRNEVRSHRSAIDAEIRAAVQSTGLLLLRGKLSALPASVERRPLAIRVLRLKSLLALLDLPAESDETAAAEVAGDPAQRVVDAVKQGFQAAAGRGRCQLPLRGEGRKHVRR